MLRSFPHGHTPSVDDHSDESFTEKRPNLPDEAIHETPRDHKVVIAPQASAPISQAPQCGEPSRVYDDALQAHARVFGIIRIYDRDNNGRFPRVAMMRREVQDHGHWALLQYRPGISRWSGAAPIDLAARSADDAGGRSRQGAWFFGALTGALSS
jgi:hypothetical protein